MHVLLMTLMVLVPIFIVGTILPVVFMTVLVTWVVTSSSGLGPLFGRSNLGLIFYLVLSWSFSSASSMGFRTDWSSSIVDRLWLLPLRNGLQDDCLD